MKILISAFTGFNYRELLLPLSPFLDKDHEVTSVIVATPAATFHTELLPDLGAKYVFIPEQKNQTDYEKVIQTYRPDICVTPTAGLEPRDIPLIKAARSLNIPTLTFVASWDNAYKMERLMTLSKYKQHYALADHFAVWNEINRQHLLKITPLKTEQVTIVGAPRLDYLVSRNLPDRSELLKRFNVPAESKLIHIATTELYSSDYLVKALAAERGQGLPGDIQLLVSVHPGGNLAAHQRYAAPSGAHVFYSFGRRQTSPVPDFMYAPALGDLMMHAALFKHSDVLINHSSTVTIESILADRPVVTVKYGRPFDWWRWRRSMVYRDFQQHAKIIIESGATQVVKSRGQLIQACRRYLPDPGLHHAERSALTRQLVPNAGGAGRRLLDLIKKVAILSR